MQKEYTLYTLQLRQRDEAADQIVKMTDQYIEEGWIDYTQAIMMLKAILDPEPDD